MQTLDELWSVLSAIRAEDVDIKSLVDDKTFDVLDRLWRTGHAEGRRVDAQGEMNEARSALIVAATRAVRPTLSLEVGFGKATSGVAILGACDAQTPQKHIAIDPMQTRAYDQNGVKNVGFIGAADRLQMIEAESCLALPFLMQTQTNSLDMIFIDSLHRFDETMLEWFYCDRLLKVGGVMIFDDTNAPAVEAVLNFIEANRPYRLKRYEEGIAFAQKTDIDRRAWYDFTEFEVPKGEPYKARVEEFIRKRMEREQTGQS